MSTDPALVPKGVDRRQDKKKGDTKGRLKICERMRKLLRGILPGDKSLEARAFSKPC